MKKFVSYFFQLVFWWAIMLIDSSEDESWDQNLSATLFMSLGIIVPAFSCSICLSRFNFNLALSLLVAFASYFLMGILIHLVFKGEKGKSPIFIKMNVVKTD